MARAKNEKPALKRSESQSLQRDLSSVYCNPWHKILDVPEKNRHPTAEWASRLVPLKFFQPNLARTQVNSITGSVSKFAFENKLIWKTNFAQDGQDNITPRGLPPRIFDKGKPIQNSWSRPIKGPSALSPLKKLINMGYFDRQPSDQGYASGTLKPNLTVKPASTTAKVLNAIASLPSLEGLRTAKEHPDHVGLGHSRHCVDMEINHWLDGSKERVETGKKNTRVSPLTFGSKKKRQEGNSSKNSKPINYDEWW